MSYRRSRSSPRGMAKARRKKAKAPTYQYPVLQKTRPPKGERLVLQKTRPPKMNPKKKK